MHGNGNSQPPNQIPGPEIRYFALQAYMGTTKHMGGLTTTQELVELCHIGSDTVVLDVGCGVGATPYYLAKRHACRVIGVDLSQRMIDRARERATREGVKDRVEFRVGDVRDLPFQDATFDAVLSESVITFVGDRRRAIGECARVAKPGGYVGLNEETWLKLPPSRVVEYAARTWGIEVEIPVCDGWKTLLRDSGLRDIVARSYKVNVLRESTQVRRYGLEELFRMLYRVLCLYLKSSAFRRYMKERLPTPRDLFDYLGYGVYVGRR